jgi:hypothetical protein
VKILLAVADVLSRDAAYNIKLEWRLIGILKNGFPIE